MSEPKTKIISKVDLLMKSLSKFYAIEEILQYFFQLFRGLQRYHYAFWIGS